LIEKQIADARRKGFCRPKEISNVYYNEKSFVRGFVLDPLCVSSFNMQHQQHQASQMEKTDILKRNLQLNIYLNDVDSEQTEIPRVFKDKNVNAFTHFIIIINNYRTDQIRSIFRLRTS
jgi:chaperonin GroEL (HSP60 family)